MSESCHILERSRWKFSNFWPNNREWATEAIPWKGKISFPHVKKENWFDWLLYGRGLETIIKSAKADLQWGIWNRKTTIGIRWCIPAKCRNTCSQNNLFDAVRPYQPQIPVSVCVISPSNSIGNSPQPLNRIMTASIFEGMVQEAVAVNELVLASIYLNHPAEDE